MLNCFKKTVKGDFVVIDSQFPQKEPFGFRNMEINEYFKRIQNFSSYTMYPMLPGPDAWFCHGYGMDEAQFNINKTGYISYYNKNEKDIHLLDREKNYRFKLACSYFLAETYVLLPFFNKNKIPFIFVLYPGGAFGIDNEKSDDMLKKIFSNKYFRGVIVTQELTREYLIKKRMCKTADITYIYGGIVQYKKNELKKKKYYLKDKKTFDICFVAAKYSEGGIDKGYDLFIEAAKKLSEKNSDIRFHVVGGFDENDIPSPEISSKITYYGYKDVKFLMSLCSEMDIFISPNRPFKLYEGNFDGFPLGIDASYCGVALFVSDELNMNREYVDRRDLVIIENDVNKIVKDIEYYFNNLDKLYELAQNGQTKTQELLDIELQISKRIDLFSRFINLKLND